MSKVHIGKKIKEVLDNSPMRATELAKRINITRVGIYKIFEKESIGAEQLKKISTVLNHDFFSYYQQQLNIVREDAPKYGFASKHDVDELTKAVAELSRNVARMQQELAKLTKSKKPGETVTYPKRRK